jgi:hypothetical protein
LLSADAAVGCQPRRGQSCCNRQRVCLQPLHHPLRQAASRGLRRANGHDCVDQSQTSLLWFHSPSHRPSAPSRRRVWSLLRRGGQSRWRALGRTARLRRRAHEPPRHRPAEPQRRDPLPEVAAPAGVAHRRCCRRSRSQSTCRHRRSIRCSSTLSGRLRRARCAHACSSVRRVVRPSACSSRRATCFFSSRSVDIVTLRSPLLMARALRRCTGQRAANLCSGVQTRAWPPPFRRLPLPVPPRRRRCP